MTNLEVNTAHLQQLAARNDDVARQIAAATRSTHNIGHDVWLGHGPSSGSSNNAVVAAQAARHAAGKALQAATTILARNLTAAATAYDHTDHHNAEHLHHQLP
ncbi:hypothetical protein I546_5355 [Mycobacterium kansasii 732]|uniref:ESX-1 secretion-associated protein n=1 Tax=Mycobacterium pseudokansasii TaxID=2341080 RepID=A0A498QX60_9MYCO|nr:type VII secretion target [Mycobacterium pseudokansasii]EUA07463.1 hypothetical protein I546_5355 [Mycobacterium kansasii 732]VBA30506.1 hypothetical protein LAUMK35_04759 [Mycobacterium pseudokansasii]VBA32300.1 hypothetical protein LAUMK21_04751 [Mycobacterium pseudokansasii]VBA54441.1 hypothetical protein LAUMK142_04659 [Mycobacterium pseudokansasii]